MKHNSPKAKQNPSKRQDPHPIESFSGPCLTNHGGGGLWQQFLTKLDVPWEGRRYGAAYYLYAMLNGLLLGFQRQSELADLREDPGALAALGLEQMPSQSAFSRFLSTCDAHLANQLLVLNRKLTAQMHKDYGSATIDLDGQVVSTRGNPERADFGYNPKRRGSKSYCVMMGILGECRDILDGWIFSGRKATVSATMAIHAYRRSRRGLPRRLRRLRLRADSAF